MDKPFERVTIVGAGVLGTQIAMLAARAGYTVSVHDTREGAFDQTYAKLHADLLAKGVDPVISREEWPRCKESIRFTTSLAEALSGADLIVESVTEDLFLKREIFAKLGEIAPGKAILATNSSSIPVSRLEDSSARPERCINAHFYMPLQGIMMADLMGGTKTLPEVMEKGEQWLRSMDVMPLRVKKENPRFLFQFRLARHKETSPLHVGK